MTTGTALKAYALHCICYPYATSYRALQEALRFARDCGLPVSVKLNGTYDALMDAALELQDFSF